MRGGIALVSACCCCGTIVAAQGKLPTAREMIILQLGFDVGVAHAIAKHCPGYRPTQKMLDNRRILFMQGGVAAVTEAINGAEEVFDFGADRAACQNALAKHRDLVEAIAPGRP